MDHNLIFLKTVELLRDKLTSKDFLEEFRVPGRFVRKGKISMHDMAVFLLFHSKATLDNKLDELKKLLPGYSMEKVSKQALSKARYGIRHQLFKELFDQAVDFYYKNIDSRKLWKKKYHLFATDGSDLEVPNSESVFEEFGKQSDKKNPDLFWSMALASVMYDVQEDIIVDAQLVKQFFGERELAVSHLSTLTNLGLHKDSIVIFDRGYFSADVYQECVNSNCFCLMRLRNTSTLCRLEGNDVITTIKAPDKTEMVCRVLKVTLSTGETEYLITNLLDKDLTCEDFRTLYFERWKIETKYLEIKERWQIEEFTGTGALAVRQDFYVTLLHANLASIVKAASDQVIALTANPDNVYQYRTRRTYVIGKLRRSFIEWLVVNCTLQDVNEMILDVSKKRSQVQPGRTRKRKRRTRARKHYTNIKTAI